MDIFCVDCRQQNLHPHLCPSFAQYNAHFTIHFRVFVCIEYLYTISFSKIKTHNIHKKTDTIFHFSGKKNVKTCLDLTGFFHFIKSYSHFSQNSHFQLSTLFTDIFTHPRGWKWPAEPAPRRKAHDAGWTSARSFRIMVFFAFFDQKCGCHEQ